MTEEAPPWINFLILIFDFDLIAPLLFCSCSFSSLLGSSRWSFGLLERGSLLMDRIRIGCESITNKFTSNYIIKV